MKPQLNRLKKDFIVRMNARNYKKSTIAKLLNLHRSTVFKYLKRWSARQPLDNKKRVRRPKLSAQKVYQVLNYVLDNPFTTYAEVVKEKKLDISPESVRKLCNGRGLKNYVASEKPFINLLHRIDRLKFAYKYKDLIDEWSSVFFADEKTIQAYRSGRVLVKRPRDERYEIKHLATKEVQTNAKVNLFGGISYNSICSVYSVSTAFNGDHLKRW